jgi:hypothetical protein
MVYEGRGERLCAKNFTVYKTKISWNLGVRDIAVVLVLIIA